ncbi:hypothetical protein BDW22DRAFT_1361946 [Trametopsis cervina]|nr:hypothetical protein BDW22DRAFT_1361946 [Trametopsis cervina]
MGRSAIDEEVRSWLEDVSREGARMMEEERWRNEVYLREEDRLTQKDPLTQEDRLREADRLREDRHSRQVLECAEEALEQLSMLEHWMEETRFRGEERLKEEQRLKEDAEVLLWNEAQQRLREDTRKRWLEATWPESTGQYATAVDLPQELFEIIVHNAVSGDGYPDREKAVAVLCRCALVALPWAKHARAILWGDVLKDHRVKKSRDAQMLRETTLKGCPRLTPVIDLLPQLRVVPIFGDGRSWLHMVGTITKIRSKLTVLELDGENAPDGFDWTLSRTPHRGTPFGTAGFPALANLARLELSNIHFAQFSDLVTVFRHFASPENVEINRVTWDKTDVPLHWPPRAVRSKRITGIKCIDIGNCTDNTLVAMAAHALDPRLPIQTLPEYDRLRLQQLSQALPPREEDRRFIVLVPELFPSEGFGPLHVTCSPAAPPIFPHVVSVLLLLTHWDDHQDQVAALHEFLQTVIHFTRLRAIGIEYDGVRSQLVTLLAGISHLAAQLPPDVIRRVLCPQDRNASEPPEWIELDWLTTEPTGQVWKCDKQEDEDHSHGDDACEDTVLARAMSSAVEEHMRKNPFAPYAAIPEVA